MLHWMRKIAQGTPVSASDALKHWGKILLLELETFSHPLIEAVLWRTWLSPYDWRCRPAGPCGIAVNFATVSLAATAQGHMEEAKKRKQNGMVSAA